MYSLFSTSYCSHSNIYFFTYRQIRIFDRLDFDYMQLSINETEYILTEEGQDLSIPIRAGLKNVNAWWCKPVTIEPVRADGFIGDVNQGGAVNFKNIFINPHGNGTHTECVGHIAKESYTINQCLKEFHFMGRVVSVSPRQIWNETYEQQDWVIDEEMVKKSLTDWTNEKALVIRTLPNSTEKMNYQYSGKNPTYFTKAAMEFINRLGVQHLMVDLPSVDREEDSGELECHKAYWNYPDYPKTEKTISELLFIPDTVQDDRYLIQIQIMSIESDASPSKIMAYKIHANHQG